MDKLNLNAGSSGIRTQQGRISVYFDSIKKRMRANKAGGAEVPFGPGPAKRVGANRGDASITLLPATDAATQRFATPLTAIRNITLSTVQAESGSRFRIVRTAAATGAFALNIGTGPLKALSAAGQWADVEFDGTAWFLTAYGSL